MKTNINLPDIVGKGYKTYWNFTGRYRVCKGSRASKKSKTTALNFITRLIQYQDANLLVVRKTYKTLNNLQSGEDYDNLKESYIIFICTYDLFKLGLPKYTFQNVCLEDYYSILMVKRYKINLLIFLIVKLILLKIMKNGGVSLCL